MGRIKVKNKQTSAPIAFEYEGETHTFTPISLTSKAFFALKDVPDDERAEHCIIKIDGKPYNRADAFLQAEAFFVFMEKAQRFLARRKELNSGLSIETASEQAQD